MEYFPRVCRCFGGDQAPRGEVHGLDLRGDCRPLSCGADCAENAGETLLGDVVDNLRSSKRFFRFFLLKKTFFKTFFSKFIFQLCFLLSLSLSLSLVNEFFLNFFWIFFGTGRFLTPARPCDTFTSMWYRESRRTLRATRFTRSWRPTTRATIVNLAPRRPWRPRQRNIGRRWCQWMTDHAKQKSLFMVSNFRNFIDFAYNWCVFLQRHGGIFRFYSDVTVDKKREFFCFQQTALWWTCCCFLRCAPVGNGIFFSKISKLRSNLFFVILPNILPSFSAKWRKIVFLYAEILGWKNIIILLRKMKFIGSQGHSEIIDIPLAFWTLDEIKSSAHSKVKREDWTGGKREKVGQLYSKHRDRGGSGLGCGRQLLPTVLI